MLTAGFANRVLNVDKGDGILQGRSVGANRVCGEGQTKMADEVEESEAINNRWVQCASYDRDENIYYKRRIISKINIQI